MHPDSGLIQKISLCLLILLPCGVLVCTAEPPIIIPGINTSDQNNSLTLFPEIGIFTISPPPVNISEIENTYETIKTKRSSVSSHTLVDTGMATMGNVVLVPVTPTPKGSGYSYFNTTGSDQSYFIYSPGIYTLQDGFSTSNNSAIYIGASDVVLEGNAHTITGNTANSGIIVQSGRYNATVRNFKNIDNFCYGIDSNGYQVSLINNSLSENSFTGINSMGPDIFLHQNTLTNNYFGVFLSGNNAILKDNVLSYNDVYGIFGTSKNCTMENNYVDSNDYGVVISGDNLLFNANNVQNNQQTGVQIQSTGAYCVGNTISQNSANFLTLGNNTTVKDNTISSAFGPFGYGIQATGTNTTISENTLYNNIFGIIAGCDDCNTINNRVYSSYQIGIVSEGNNDRNSDNIIRDYAITGLACYSNNSVAYNNTITNVTYGFVILDYLNTSIIGNQIHGAKQYGIFISGDYYHPGPGIGNIYNNYFGNEKNVGGFVNISKYSYRWTNPIGQERGTNIVGGPFIAGNYWSNSTETGWSDQQTPNVSGYTTTPFVIAPGRYDTAPLVPQKPVTINATANDWGIIVPTGNRSYQSYTNQTFITQPKPGADITDVVVDSVSKGNVTSWTFTELSDDHNIQAIGNATPGQVHVFFNASQQYGERPLTVSFSSEQSLGSPTSWYWQFGDGIPNTTQNPVHTYEIPGIYPVSLRALNGQTGGYAVWNNYITVTDGLVPEPTQTPVPGKIITKFSAYPTHGNAPLTVDFRDKSSGNPVTWDWDFGDGAHSSLQNPSHVYTTSGSYPVTLSLKNENYGGSLNIPGAVIVT